MIQMLSMKNTTSLYSYLFMFKCWHIDPDERPIFSELVGLMSQKLGRMAGYMDVSTLDECMPLNSDTEN